MNRKTVMMTIGLSAAVAGCSAFQPQAELNIRAVDTERLARSDGDALAQGREQLMLGQNGLAISSFRAALRDQPENPDAYNGLGIAYDRIGRRDLAQRYFELAVAGAPENPKFTGNLARLLERDGKAHMAQGLGKDSLAVVVQQASPEPVAKSASLADKPLILAAVADVELATAGANAEIVTAIPEVAEGFDLEPAANGVGEPVTTKAVTPIVPQYAVYRPAAPVAIRAAAIDPASLPSKPLKPAPSEKQAPAPFDAPRTPYAPAQREGIRLERVSLGEVRLITRPQASPVQQRTAVDFDGFGVRLASWLPAAVAKEQAGTGAMPGKGPALKQAVSRAALEIAVAEADSTPVTKAEKVAFTYAFFDDDRIVETSLAAL